jgi:hypothetical protein
MAFGARRSPGQLKELCMPSLPLRFRVFGALNVAGALLLGGFLGHRFVTAPDLPVARNVFGWLAIGTFLASPPALLLAGCLLLPRDTRLLGVARTALLVSALWLGIFAGVNLRGMAGDLRHPTSPAGLLAYLLIVPAAAWCAASVIVAIRLGRYEPLPKAATAPAGQGERAFRAANPAFVRGKVWLAGTLLIAGTVGAWYFVYGPGSSEHGLKGLTLYQPLFFWDGAEPSYQGTGFFARAPNGKVVAVTSLLFLYDEEPALLEARWLDVRTEKPVASFTRSWGRPPAFDPDRPIVDLPKDFLLMPVAEGVSIPSVLELDPQPRPDLDETVWFSDKDPEAPRGFRPIAGIVAEITDERTTVFLEKPFEPESQSGSPIISQRTGKVIGILAGGGNWADNRGSP